MNKNIAKYDGRQTLFGRELHQAAGCIVGTDGAIAGRLAICTAIDATTRVILFSSVVHADRRKSSSSISV